VIALCLLGHGFAHAKLAKPQTANYPDIASFLRSQNITSLDEYISWLSDHVHYAADDTSDDWADPMHTLNKKSGDCEDLAFLNAEVVKYFGHESQVLAYGHGKEAHVICLFIKEGKYYIFDNTKFYRDVTSPSLKEIFLFLAKKHEARFLLKLTRDPKRIDVLYTYQGTLSNI